MAFTKYTICNKEFLVYPYQIKYGKGKFCSKKCYGKWQSINIRGKKHPNWREGKIKCVCLSCNKEFYKYPSWIKRGWGKFCSQGCRAIYYNMHSHKQDTSIERAVEQELQRRHIPFMKQVPIPFAHTVVDFLLDNKIVIYCDGDYWHSIPKMRNKDINQDTLLTLSGYKVFRLKEKNINKNVAKCIDKIFKRVGYVRMD